MRQLTLFMIVVLTLNLFISSCRRSPEQVYDGWEVPDEIAIECFCLESPKLFHKDGWYCMVSAQGGTAGPTTAHMAVVARAQSPTGPWEKQPRDLS